MRLSSKIEVNHDLGANFVLKCLSHFSRWCTALNFRPFCPRFCSANFPGDFRVCVVGFDPAMGWGEVGYQIRRSHLRLSRFRGLLYASRSKVVENLHSKEPDEEQGFQLAATRDDAATPLVRAFRFSGTNEVTSPPPADRSDSEHKTTLQSLFS